MEGVRSNGSLLSTAAAAMSVRGSASSRDHHTISLALPNHHHCQGKVASSRVRGSYSNLPSTRNLKLALYRTVRSHGGDSEPRAPARRVEVRVLPLFLQSLFSAPLTDASLLPRRYEMRREMQLILPGLYLGPSDPSKSLPKLHAAGITGLLVMRSAHE